MIRDITLGQYFPGDSWVHKLDPRIKIIATKRRINLRFQKNMMKVLLQKSTVFLVQVMGR